MAGAGCPILLQNILVWNKTLQALFSKTASPALKLLLLCLIGLFKTPPEALHWQAPEESSSRRNAEEKPQLLAEGSFFSQI